MPLEKDRKIVAIAVPLTERHYLTDEEKISIKHLETYLGGYDRYLIEPKGMNFNIDGFYIKEFEREYFGSVQAHRKMLFSEKFYKSFEKYQYILIHHTDALVFSDQLAQWCQRGYDYVAPPWISHKDAPYAGMPAYEGKVGNGGFSLRRIDAILKVLNSHRLWRDPVQEIRKAFRSRKPLVRRSITFAKALRFFLPIYNGVRQELDSYLAPEDHFWANRAVHYYPGFRIAPLEEALKFAFECVPRYCYEQNQNRLPFGCHAWARYDREFWKPFLLDGAI